MAFSFFIQKQWGKDNQYLGNYLAVSTNAKHMHTPTRNSSIPKYTPDRNANTYVVECSQKHL